jgi:hypothetical protein
VDVQALATGLWRWTGLHAAWKQEVGSVYLEAEDTVVLIDPLVPPDEPERFWRKLERDVTPARGCRCAFS